MGLQHPPTILWWAMAALRPPPVEVEDRTKLDQIIEDMLQKAPAPAAKKPAAKKTPAKKAAQK